jgi:hypothetical protein
MSTGWGERPQSVANCINNPVVYKRVDQSNALQAKRVLYHLQIVIRKGETVFLSPKECGIKDYRLSGTLTAEGQSPQSPKLRQGFAVGFRRFGTPNQKKPSYNTIF